MLLDRETIKELIKQVESGYRTEMRAQDKDRWLIYNGSMREIILKEIRKEFKKPETVDGLSHRIVPLNILRKIIIKLAGIYLEAPKRSSVDGNERDNKFISILENSMSLNLRQKEANRYFKLYKRNLQEPYVDRDGMIRLRNLPRHTYEVFSTDPVSPERPNIFVKILKWDSDSAKRKYAFWTDFQYLVVDGNGNIDIDHMESVGNLDMINPYGKAPFVYTNESSDSVDPIANDDLYRCSLLIPILLTDLAFAQKFQTWSIIYVKGDFQGDIPMNPNSIITLPRGKDGELPDLGTIKPEFDLDKAVAFIETILATLLTTNNLSAGAIAGKLSASNLASGISKVLDEAVSTEDKKDQQDYFIKAENDLWELLSKHMIPIWRAQGKLNPKVNFEFSSNFEIKLQLQDPKVVVSDKEKVEISKLKIEAGLSSKVRELQKLYPDENAEEIFDEIELEKVRARNLQNENMESEAV